MSTVTNEKHRFRNVTKPIARHPVTFTTVNVREFRHGRSFIADSLTGSGETEFLKLVSAHMKLTTTAPDTV